MPDVDYERMFAQIAERFKPGGIVEAGQLADIEAGKRQAISRGTQQLVSSGLGTTTVAAGVPIAAEEVAGRARLGVRGKTAGQLSTLEVAMASLLEKARLTEAQLAQQRYLAGEQTALGYAGLAQRGAEATTGLDVFGRPMAGTEAYARMQALQRQGQAGGGAGDGQDFYAQQVSGYTGAGAGGGTGGGARFGGESTIGQAVIGGPQAGGMYLGGGRFLSPEQVEWKTPEEGGPYIPGSTQQAVDQIGMREADPSMVPAGVTGGAESPLAIFAERHERQQEIARIMAARGY